MSIVKTLGTQVGQVARKLAGVATKAAKSQKAKNLAGALAASQELVDLVKASGVEQKLRPEPTVDGAPQQSKDLHPEAEKQPAAQGEAQSALGKALAKSDPVFDAQPKVEDKAAAAPREKAKDPVIDAGHVPPTPAEMLNNPQAFDPTRPMGADNPLSVVNSYFPNLSAAQDATGAFDRMKWALDGPISKETLSALNFELGNTPMSLLSGANRVAVKLGDTIKELQGELEGAQSKVKANSEAIQAAKAEGLQPKQEQLDEIKEAQATIAEVTPRLSEMTDKANLIFESMRNLSGAVCTEASAKAEAGDLGGALQSLPDIDDQAFLKSGLEKLSNMEQDRFNIQAQMAEVASRSAAASEKYGPQSNQAIALDQEFKVLQGKFEETKRQQNILKDLIKTYLDMSRDLLNKIMGQIR